MALASAAMASNGKRTPPRPRLQLAQARASPEEAAAAIAAVEQFLRDTAFAPAAAAAAESPWLRAGRLEGVGLGPSDRGPWGE